MVLSESLRTYYGALEVLKNNDNPVVNVQKQGNIKVRVYKREKKIRYSSERASQLMSYTLAQKIKGNT